MSKKKSLPKSIRRYFNLALTGPLGLTEDQVNKYKQIYASRGKNAEKRFIIAWRNPRHYPTWMQYVRKATKKEDYHEKTDAVIGKVGGGIYRIQIKAAKKISQRRRNTFSKEGIILVRVPDHFSEIDIRDETIRSIELYLVYHKQAMPGE